MNDLATNTMNDDPELVSYLKRNVGITRTRLNVQAFIGIFIFGWLMAMNYDALQKKGLGWAFVIVYGILLALVYNGVQGVFVAALIVYIAAWIHTNTILTEKEKSARVKFLQLKKEQEMPKMQQVDGTAQSSETAAISGGQLMTVEAEKIINQASDPKIARFLAITQNTWKMGALDFFSDNFKNGATDVDLKGFIKSVEYQTFNLLKTSNSIREFENGEYMVGYSNNAFLMTNLAIYFFTAGNLSHRPDIILLKDIKSYEIKSKWNSVSVNIELKSGNPVTYPKIKGGPVENMVAHFIS